MEQATMSDVERNAPNSIARATRFRVARMAITLAIGLVGIGLIAQPAAADPQVKADDIVSFFAKEVQLGAGRGLCIGTAQECENGAKKPAGLDMLINFDLDSAELTGQARQNLDEFAKALNNDQLSAARFVVEGYTDGRGTENYNLGLSERRAEAVTNFLFERGVAKDKVVAVGKGEANPRVPDQMDPVNRRVEM